MVKAVTDEYEKPRYALYVCELLNGIPFRNGFLVVKPRDNTDNARQFYNSRWSNPRGRQYSGPVYYKQLNRLRFEEFDVDEYLQGERDQNDRNSSMGRN
ncbi:hypothetical protein M3Y99_01202200 [Aphelenchoides fujianensis]|nr:hypothetical protein M3Y99_01202200 [Aphelenchoides fujianensis]